MEIAIRTNSSSVDIIILGTIKTVADAQNLKDAIRKAHEYNASHAINVHIKDSFIITSSVIGFLVKSIKIDKMALSIYVTNKELYVMLEDMNLIESLNARKA